MQPLYYWTSVIIWLYSKLSACAFHYKNGGWRETGNEMEIKADMILLNLFQLDELKGGGGGALRSWTSHQHHSFIIHNTASKITGLFMKNYYYYFLFLPKARMTWSMRKLFNLSRIFSVAMMWVTNVSFSSVLWVCVSLNIIWEQCAFVMPGLELHTFCSWVWGPLGEFWHLWWGRCLRGVCRDKAKACPYRYMAGRGRVREEGNGQEGGGVGGGGSVKYKMRWEELKNWELRNVEKK